MDHESSVPSSFHINDVIEVIQTTDPDFTDKDYNPTYSSISTPTQEEKQRAFIEIIEQPAPKALRFRYECEGRSAGSIPGVNSSVDNKTYPRIRVVGYVGRAVVVVSCVTKDPPYRPHPHSLVGKEGCKRGVCTVELSEDMTATFSNLGIQCVKKKDIYEALQIREEIRVDPYRTGFSHRNQPNTIDLNAVRLCFQVFLEGNEKGKFTYQLQPAVSDPIYDKKAMSDLIICKLSDCSASVAGGKEIILLCEKVAKEDIQVRFFEQDCSGNVVWEAQGDFTPAHVHKQVAISLRTPRYHVLEISQPVDAYIQLRRPSDGATSEALSFQLLPLDSGRSWLRRKVKGDYSTFCRILASNTALLTGGAASSMTRTSADSVEQVADPERLSSLPRADVEFKMSEEAKALLYSVVSPVPVEDTKTVKSTDIVNNMDKISFDKDQLEEKHMSDYSDVQIDKFPSLSDKLTKTLLEQLKNDESFKTPDLSEACQSINELLSQVTDFSGAVTPDSMQVDDVYNDQIYSSLQLAMKNPIELLDNLASEKYEDVMTVPHNAESLHISILPSSQTSMSNKRDPLPTPTTPDTKLPPLPPKRIRKSPPAPPARPEAPPNKTLPPPPSVELNSKQSSRTSNLFSKLFSKKLAKPKKSSTLKESISEELGPREATPQGSISELYFPQADLTEAEHYALYTDMAPRATVSEFDEVSFYYSPVEGGDVIVSQSEDLKTRSNNEKNMCS